MHKRTLLIVFLGLFSLLVRAQKNNPFNWLQGNWKFTIGNNYIVEQWKIVNDTVALGISFFIQNQKDSAIEETIELVQKNGVWLYIPTTAKQNESKPIPFTIIYSKEKEFIAINTAHDFPQRIAYRLIGNKLYASIEGEKNKKYRKKNFDYIKTF